MLKKKMLIALGVAAVLSVSCVSAVSYTHLDVYKRQIYFHSPNNNSLGVTPSTSIIFSNVSKVG